MAIYCEELKEKTFLVPIEVAAERGALRSRIAPPRNSQRASINLAQGYPLGAIAQLGERPAGSREVVGSSPTSSITSESASEIEIGASAFRDRFGYWMERAAAGEQILITRHGRPFARLGPVDPTLDPATADAD